MDTYTPIPGATAEAVPLLARGEEPPAGPKAGPSSRRVCCHNSSTLYYILFYVQLTVLNYRSYLHALSQASGHNLDRLGQVA